MTTTWETVHVFISSTFKDMHAERDYLVKRVFPELREWCEQRKLRLVDIDLRWGVTEADITGKHTVKVCLERLNQCQPLFFLCFLGQRNGWMPTVTDISIDTFDEFPTLREALGPATSITELEIRHAWLRPFASRDPHDPSHLIQHEPVTHACFYFRDPGYLEVLQQSAGTPRQLLCTYSEEVGPEDEKEKERQMRPRARDALRALQERITATGQQPVTYTACWRAELHTPELAMLLECPSSAQAPASKWSEEWQRFAHLQLAESDLRVPEAQTAAANVYNNKLTTGRLGEFQARARVGEPFPAGTALAEVILRDLQEAIAARYSEHREVVEESDLQQELDQQEQFLVNSCEGFIERGKDFDELDAYVESEERKLLVLTAPGGLGKSTLLATWVERYRQQIASRPEQSLHFRFLGTSDGSATVYSLLRFLLREVKELAGKLEADIPMDPLKLREAFPGLLAEIGQRGKTVIVLDALNQLETGLNDLGWLPRELPANIKLIVSFKRDEHAPEPTVEEVYHGFRERGQVIFSEVQPFVQLEHRRKLVQAYLAHYLKELDEPQLEALIHAEGAANPLYLKVVLAELRVSGTFANLEAKIRGDFGDTPISAFGSILARLESDPAYSPLEPRQAVPLLLGLLAHARRGLSADEMTSLLLQALGRPDTRESRQDAADTVYLYLQQVRPFLARREGRYDFFFESFRLSAQQRYVVAKVKAGLPERPAKGWHLLLADYFEKLPTWQEHQAPTAECPLIQKMPVRRKVAELPYHLTHAEEWDRLEATLCDLRFVEAKCAAGLVYDLEADFDVALAALPEAQQEQEQARSHQQEVARYTQDLIAYAQAWSEARARHDPDPARNPLPLPEAIPLPTLASVLLWTDEKIRADAERIIHEPTRRDRLRAFAAFVKSESHALAQFAMLPGFCVQQAHNYADIGPVVEAADSLIHQDYGDTPLLFQQSMQRPTYTPHPALVRTLGGHRDGVNSVSITPDGMTAVSASGDGTVRVWDLPSGQCRFTFEVDQHPGLRTQQLEDKILSLHRSRSLSLNVWRRLEHENAVFSVTSICITPDGTTAIAGCDDGNLHVWNLVTGECRCRLQGHIWVTSVSITPNGTTAVSGGRDKTLRVWDLVTGQCLYQLKGHKDWVTSVSLTPDGTTAISGSEDLTLRVWDLPTRQCRRVLEGHAHCITSVNLTPDATTAISASLDKTLGVWNLTTGQYRPLLNGHRDKIWSVCLVPDGKTAVSGSWDSTIRVWNLTSGQCEQTLEDSYPVICVRVTPDGAILLSGSFDTTVRIWDLSTGHPLHLLKGHSDGVTSISVTPDGATAVSGSYDGTLRVWDLTTGQCRSRLKGHTDSVYGVGVTPDGTRAVSGSGDKTLRVWDLITGQYCSMLEGHTDSVFSVSLTPDGRTVVSGSRDRTVRVWNLTNGQCQCVMKGHTDMVTGVSVSSDGTTILSGSRDGTLRAWDLATGRRLAIFHAPSAVWSISEVSAGGCISLGTENRYVIVAALRNFSFTPPLVTTARLWSLGLNAAESRWGVDLTVRCAHCGQQFVPPHVPDAIHSLSARFAANDSPCLELPPEAWDEPGLSSQCPHCHQLVRFNPFVLDQRDRVQRATAKKVSAGPVPSSPPLATPEEKVSGARSWLVSTLAWCPLIIAVLSYCLGTLPAALHFDRSLAWATLVGLIVAWVGMGAMPTLSEQPPREEGLALAGAGALVAAGVLMVGLLSSPPIGLVGLGLIGVAVGIVTGVAGGLASPRVKNLTDMAAGLAVSTAAVGAFVTGSLVAERLGGGLLGWGVGGIAGLVALVVAFLAAMLVARLIIKIIQVITQVGPAGGVLIGLVAGGILVWLGNVRVGEAVALLAGLAYSLAVGIASVMQKAPEAERFPRLGWGMNIAVAVSLLVLVWICLLGSWPIQAH